MADSDWTTVEPETLPGAIRAKYDTMKAQYRAYAQDKAAFEQAMQEAFGKHLDESSELKFGYKFGKLSIAVGPKRNERAAKRETKPTLSEWLTQQNGQGRRI